ncbi:hypothetical protein BaRGS_00013010 [Batillaria attramentaria]|uniref:Netrin receptor UNC5 n=1 Tax=Batillaria attramentaria TaxID=370345 RepID=A0ABD0L9C2_9CAEN
MASYLAEYSLREGMQRDFNERVRELREELHQVADNLDRVYREKEKRRQRQQRKRLAAFVVGALGLIAASATGGASLLIAGAVLAGGVVITFIYEYIISEDRLRLVEMNWFRYRDIWAENLGAAGRMGGRPVTKEDLKLYDEILNSRNPLLNILLLGVTIETVIRMSLGHPGDLVRRLERDLDKLPTSVSEIRDEDIIPEVRRQMKFDLEKFRREDKERRREEEEGPRQKETLAPRPLCGVDWSMSNDYTSKGGELQCPGSDVKLRIPEKAIKKSDKITVKAAVSTELEIAHSALKLSDDEVIASPVVEYSSGQDKDFKFDEPVIIKMPHFVPQDCPEDSIRVYKFRRDSSGVLQKVRLERSKEDQKTSGNKVRHTGDFTCADKQLIHIRNYHFCVYVVCYEPHRMKTPEPLRLRLHGRHIQRDTRDVDLWLCMGDRRIDIVDFRKNMIPDEANDCFIIGKSLQPPTCVSSVQVGASLSVDWENRHLWSFHEHSDQGEKRFDLEIFYPAIPENPASKASAYTSPQVVMWALQHTKRCPPSKWFSCAVQVGYVRVQQGPLSFLDRPEKQNLPAIKLKVTQERGDDSEATPLAGAGHSNAGAVVNINKANNVCAVDHVHFHPAPNRVPCLSSEKLLQMTMGRAACELPKVGTSSSEDEDP